MTLRFTEVRTSGRTLEWERLPAVGANRHHARAITWQNLLIALGAFWLIVGLGIAVIALL
jgi:hypothetical protein